MSCRLVSCTAARAHHHHTRAGQVLLEACLCTRPETIERPSIEQLLDFAHHHPGKLDGHTAAILRDELGITPVRFLQLLSEAIHTEEALAYDPLTTYRLRREADHRARAREARHGH
ncbi:DUF3263 domain-containing protein [Microbacterium saperdae]